MTLTPEQIKEYQELKAEKEKRRQYARDYYRQMRAAVEQVQALSGTNSKPE